MSARRSVSVLSGTVVAALLLTACSSGSDNSIGDTSIHPTSYKVLDNGFDPSKLLKYSDAQKLVPGAKVTHRTCYMSKRNGDKLFPSNAQVCDFPTAGKLNVRVATTVDNSETRGSESALDNSGLLIDTGGSTGRYGIHTHLNGVQPYHASVYARCDHYNINDEPPCPRSGEAAKKADRISFDLTVPGRPHNEYVTVVIQYGHDIPVSRLNAAANTAIKNLNKEFSARH